MLPGLCSFSLFLAAVQAAPTPAPETSSRPPTPAPELSGWSTFWWGDYDGDGLADAWVVRAGAPGRLLRNAGDGNFIDVTGESGLDAAPEAHMALWADYDGDGRLDLFLASWGQPSQLLRQSAPGRFDDVSLESGLGSSDLVVDAEWRDYDGDGAPDLRLTRFGEETLLHNAGQGAFERIVLDLPPALGLDPWVLPGSPDEARRLLALAPVQPGSGSGASAASGGGSASFVAQPLDTCARSIEDVSNPAVCLPASSIPTLGMLYPLSNEFYIDGASSFVGIGTTTPGAKLDVFGGDVRTSGRFESLATSGAPLIVNSNTRVANLNADKLDGFDAAQLFVLGSSIELGELSPDSVDSSKVVDESLTAADLGPGSVSSSELAFGSVTALKIAANSIVNAHIAAAASIAGTKIVPDFGTQAVTSTGVAEFSSNAYSGPYGLRVESSNGPTRGYLGVQGDNDHDGVLSADWAGREIGVAGISTGASDLDNYGVVGHSNGVGVRGESAGDPNSFGELGLQGTGLYATGSTYAADLDGALHIDVSTIDRPGVEVTQTGSSRTAAFIQDSDSSGSATLFASNNSTNSASHTLLARNTGSGAGEVALFQTTDTGHSGVNTRIEQAGSGEALVVESANSDRTVVLTRSTNHLAANDMLQIDVPSGSSANSQFIECERGVDVEFRVDGDGDVFADGAYTGPADFAEMIAVSSGAVSVQAGDVLVIDPTARRSVRTSTQAYSTLVAGVYSTAPGFVGSERDFIEVDEATGERKPLKRADMAERHQEVPMAVIGIVPCKVSLENGPIAPGDLLVTSSTAGHAMRDAAPPVGTVIGKALEPFDGQKGALGTIRILVTLQ